MRICDLREKEVINVCDCRRLGCVADVDIDCKTGCVVALIIPVCGKFFDIFSKDTEYVIPWKKVCQIGPDIILVEVKEEDVLKKCRI